MYTCTYVCVHERVHVCYVCATVHACVRVCTCVLCVCVRVCCLCVCVQVYVCAVWVWVSACVYMCAWECIYVYCFAQFLKLMNI